MNDSNANPVIEAFLDHDTETISYVVSDPATGCAAVIDPVLNYNPRSGRTSTDSADRIGNYLKEHGLRVQWLLETHAHADHLSGAHVLRARHGGTMAIGEKIGEVQKIFKGIFNLSDDYFQGDAQFDHLFHADEIFHIGELQAQALFVPGHTPADMAYKIGDAIFVGDTLFMPDVGTARCDFPGGDARQMYHSVQKLLSFPGETRLFMCHDYPPEGRLHHWKTTVAEQRSSNIHIRDGIAESAFVDMRRHRDAGLEMPTLIMPSIQVNIRAGALPPAESNGTSYLKIPLNTL